jgi:AcrR family transcriptional regulator
MGESRRSDAERNIVRIQEAATRLWADNPTAGVAEVATAAGVGRATLYRHFPTRESLLEAIRSQGLADGERAAAGCRLDEGTATEALGRLLCAWFELGDRYRVIVVNPSRPEQVEVRAQEERLAMSIHRVVERGQALGEFSTAIAPYWGMSAVGALLVAMIVAVGEGRIPREHAHALLIETVAGALRPR